MTIEAIIEEELAKRKCVTAVNEFNVTNVRTFNKMLENYMHNPVEDSRYFPVVDENLSIAIESLNTLKENSFMPKCNKFVERLYSIRKTLERFIDELGVRGKINNKVGKTYVKLNNYLKDIGYFEIPKREKETLDYAPTLSYARHYKQYRDEAVKKTMKGENPLNYIRKEKAALDMTSLDGIVRSLALDGVEDFLFTGVDTPKRNLDSLTMSAGNQLDNLITETAYEQEHLKRIERLSLVTEMLGYEETLSSTRLMLDYEQIINHPVHATKEFSIECPFCENKYNSYKQMANHVEKKHPNEKMPKRFHVQILPKSAKEQLSRNIVQSIVKDVEARLPTARRL